MKNQWFLWLISISIIAGFLIFFAEGVWTTGLGTAMAIFITFRVLWGKEGKNDGKIVMGPLKIFLSTGSGLITISILANLINLLDQYIDNNFEIWQLHLIKMILGIAAGVVVGILAVGIALLNWEQKTRVKA